MKTYSRSAAKNGLPKLMGSAALILICAVLFSSSGFSQTPGTQRWVVPALGHVSSSPVIAEDGTIYVGAGNDLDAGNFGWVYSISPQGSTNWVLTFPKHVRSSPAIGPDGRIYVGCMNGDLIMITPTGDYSTVATGGAIQSSPAISVDGTIYVGSVSNYFNKLYAVRPDGSIHWVFTMGAVPVSDPEGLSEQFSSPSIGPDGTIYIGSIDGSLYSVTPDGRTNWVFPLMTTTSSTSTARTFCSPSIGVDGTIYIGADNGVLYAIDPQGFKKWEFFTGGIIESSPAVGPDGSVYVGSLSGSGLFVLAPEGNLKWNIPGLEISASPAIAANGNVIVGTWRDQLLLAFDSLGSNLWKFSTWQPFNGALFSSPAIGADGTIYFGSGTKLFAVYGTSGIASGAWPMFRENTKHTARSVQRGVQKPSVLADGTVAVNFRVETGRTYRVHYSSNLIDWNVLTNFVSSTCTNQIIDTSAKNSAPRYYRLSTTSQ